MIEDPKLVRLLALVEIDAERQVRLPEKDFAGSQVFRGTNTLTKERDVFVALPLGGGRFRVFRWSGKNGEWFVNADSIDIPPCDYMRSYKTARDVRKVEPQWIKSAKAVQPKPKKEGGSAMSLSKVFGKFGKCPKGDFAVSIQGNVAIKRKNGGYACLQDGKLVDIDTLAVDIDAFYFIPVSPAQLAVNDVVLVGKDGIGFVMGVDGNKIEVYDVNNEVVSTVQPATHFLMPHPFVTKVVSLISPDANGGGLNPLMFLLLADKGKDMGKMLPLMLLMQGQQAGQAINPMMLMLMMQGDGDMNKMLPFMLMGQNGAAGMNPLLMALALGGDGGMDDLLPLMLMTGGLGGCCKPETSAPAKAVKAKVEK